MSTHPSDMSMGGLPQVGWGAGELEVNKMSSPWGTLRQKHSRLFQSTGTGKTHGTHSLSPFQVHAGVWFGDQKVRRGEERRGRMYQKDERRKGGAEPAAQSIPEGPALHTQHTATRLRTTGQGPMPFTRPREPGAPRLPPHRGCSCVEDKGLLTWRKSGSRL